MSGPLSSAVCPGCRQPLPASLAAGPPQLTCYQCGAVFANPLVPATHPQGTYGQQFRQSPVSTYLFGPQLNAYQGHADPRAHAERRQQYRFWLVVLAAIMIFSAVVPFLFGTLHSGLFMGACASAYCFFFSGLWGLGYGIGLMMYGGALFEKPWFMNSKRAREKRALWGDVKTRNIYMTFGRFMMVATGVITTGNTLLSCSALLLGSLTPGKGGNRGTSRAVATNAQPATPSPAQAGHVKSAEERVLFERRELEARAAEVRAAVKDYAQLEAEVAQRPSDIAKRQQLDERGRSLGMVFDKYETAVESWRKRTIDLQKVALENGTSSGVLDRNRTLPPELTFSNPATRRSAGNFPTQEVEFTENQLENALNRLADLQNRRRINRMELRVGSIGKMDQYRSRLEEIEKEFGYHSPVLDRLPSREELAKLAERADLADNQNRSLNPTGPATPQSGERPSFPAPPGAPEGKQPGGPAGFALLDRFDETRQVLRGAVTTRGFGPQRELQIGGNTEGVLVEFDAPMFLRFTLNARVTRRAGKGPLFFVLPLMDRSAVLVVDGPSLRTGLEALDGAPLDAQNAKTGFAQGEHLPQDKPVFLRCEVDGPSVVLTIGEVVVYRWRGDPRALSVPANYQVANPKRLHFGSQDATFRIELPVVNIGGPPRPSP